MHNDELAELEPLLLLCDVQKFIPLSRPHIYKLISAGRFPKQLRIGENRVAWRQSDIRKYQNGCRDWGSRAKVVGEEGGRKTEE
jgi:predicted DNA-binding transcriptional regulator AlpA